ncbi:hypothetical protein O3P69_001279 [Scylla paramamosain]|uniref:Uncharacterized protein n=1 Tax=Scylla paramamosain TaxID=85552 RepID=A0AAW0UPK1_SCYPA
MRVSVALMFMGAVLLANLLTVNAVPSLYRSLNRRSADSSSGSDGTTSEESPVVKRSLDILAASSGEGGSTSEEVGVVKRSLDILAASSGEDGSTSEEVGVVKRSPRLYASNLNSDGTTGLDNLDNKSKRPYPGLLTKSGRHVLAPAGQSTMPAEDLLMVADSLASLEDMDIVEDPHPTPSTQGSQQNTATTNQPSLRRVSAPAPDSRQRCHLLFPRGHGKTTSELFSWFAALIKQHPDLQPLYKKGRNQPYTQ